VCTATPTAKLPLPLVLARVAALCGLAARAARGHARAQRPPNSENSLLPSSAQRFASAQATT